MLEHFYRKLTCKKLLALAKIKIIHFYFLHSYSLNDEKGYNFHLAIKRWFRLWEHSRKDLIRLHHEATLLDLERRAFAFGSVKDRPRSGKKKTRKQSPIKSTIEPCSNLKRLKLTSLRLEQVGINNPYAWKCAAPGISHHDIIYVTYSLKCHRPTPKKITYRDLKRIDDTILIRDALDIPWGRIWTLHSVDEKVTKLNEYILTLYDKHAPLRTKKVKKRPSPWMSTLIRDMMVERDLAFKKYGCNKSDENFDHYKRLRNKTTQEIRIAKLRHYHGMMEPRTNPTLLWQDLRTIGLMKPRTQVENITFSLETLNDHFTSVRTSTINETLKQQTTDELLNKPLPIGEHCLNKDGYLNCLMWSQLSLIKETQEMVHEGEDGTAYLHCPSISDICKEKLQFSLTQQILDNVDIKLHLKFRTKLEIIIVIVHMAGTVKEHCSLQSFNNTGLHPLLSSHGSGVLGGPPGPTKLCADDVTNEMGFPIADSDPPARELAMEANMLVGFGPATEQISVYLPDSAGRIVPVLEAEPLNLVETAQTVAAVAVDSAGAAAVSAVGPVVPEVPMLQD
ncbi:hypothetical protein C0J52_21277 [Blattella germanica]|nr:hypothetical protein C0J52_21277 [Blattella germanica]